MTGSADEIALVPYTAIFEAVAIYELCDYTGLGSREGDVYLA